MQNMAAALDVVDIVHQTTTVDELVSMAAENKLTRIGEHGCKLTQTSVAIVPSFATQEFAQLAALGILIVGVLLMDSLTGAGKLLLSAMYLVQFSSTMDGIRV